MLFLYKKLDASGDGQELTIDGIQTSLQDSVKGSERMAVLGMRSERERDQEVDDYMKKHDAQAELRWGYVKEMAEGKEIHEMLEKIQEKLYGVFNIPKGRIILIDSPQINAYVIRGKSDIYVHMGLLNALALWCKRHGKKFTEDKIAMILSHEMTHIEQGTEEKRGHEERGEFEMSKAKSDMQDSKNAEYDADRTGLIRLAQAGYNPREGVEAIGFLKSLGDGLPIFSTHPRNFDREREMHGMIENEDSFIPNVAKEATIVPDHITSKIVANETLSHPGTRLFRADGLKNLEGIMERADNLYDALEVAEVAQAHDLRIFASHEKVQENQRMALAKRIILYNFQAVTLFLHNSGVAIDDHNKASVIVEPSEGELYLEKEFPPADTLSDQAFDATPLIKTTEASVLDVFDDFLGWAKRVNNMKKDQIEAKIGLIADFKSHPSLSKKDAEQLAALEKEVSYELPRLNLATSLTENDGALVKKALDQVDSGTLDKIIVQTEIEKDKDRRRHAHGIPKDIANKSAGEVAEWCSSHGDAFFSANSKDRRKTVSDRIVERSMGTVSIEDSYESYLGKEFEESVDVETPEGRRLYATSLVSSKSAMDAGQMIYEKILATGNASRIPKIEAVFDCDVNTKRVLPMLVAKFQRRYANWGVKDAPKLGELMAKTVLQISTRGYNPEELREIVENMAPSDLKIISKKLPDVVIREDRSASDLFMSETGYVLNGSAFSLQRGLEKDLLESAKERLSKMPEYDLLDPKKELLQIQDLLEKSVSSTTELHTPRILELVEALQPKTAEELEELIGPFLLATQTGESHQSSRSDLFNEILEHFKGKIAAVELMKFHEGESKIAIWDFFKSVWDHPAEKNKLSEAEQLEFLAEFLRLMPEVKGSSGPRSKESRDGKKLTEKYLQLYKKLNPEASIKEPLMLTMVEGVIRYNPDSPQGPEAGILINQEMEAWYNGLSREEVMELAEFFVEKKGDFKKFYSGAKTMAVDISCAALAYANGRAVTKIRGLSKEMEDHPNQIFDTKIPIAENLAIVEKYVHHHRSNVVAFCLSAYGLYDKNGTISDDNLRRIVETAEENPNAAAMSGAVNLLSPVGSNSVNFDNLFSDIRLSSADTYDPNSQKSFLDVFKKSDHTYLRKNLLNEYIKRFGLLDGQIHDDPNDEIVKTRQRIGAAGLRFEAQAGAKIDIQLSERVQKILKLIPEVTDFKDELFAEIEALELKRFGLEAKGHRIVTKTALDQAAALELHDFYLCVIPHLADLDKQQLWSRRADDLYNDFLADGKESFSDALERIQKVYPVASGTRDEALLRLGDTVAVKEPWQAKAITGLLFENQRRTKEEREKSQQKFLEYFGEFVAKLSRNEKKDFLLWEIGARSFPPLTIMAFGGYHKCSVETIPELIFAATGQEREVFFIRLLYGENGVLDPRDPEGKVVFDQLLESSFEKIFPSNEATPEERKIIKTVFTSVFNNYSSFRRSKIFIAMIEALRNDQGKSSFAERVRIMMEQLGPVFIKAGQVMSEEEKADGKPLLKPTLQKEFRGLKQGVKSFHRIGAFQSLESMGAFDEFNEDRILQVGDKLGSASIKVVFRSFNSQGKKEVVKVRRPSIGKHLEEDLFVLEKVVEALRADGAAVPPGIDKKIRTWLREEANFDLEMKNHREVGAVLGEYNVARDKSILPEVQIRVPQVSCNSSEHIQEEFAEGLSLEDLMAVKRGEAHLDGVLAERFGKDSDLEGKRAYYAECLANLDQYRVLAFDSLMYQIFQKGRFHADTHAGNIVITPKNEMIYIDLGSAGEIKSENIDAVKKFFHGYMFTSNPMLKGFVPAGIDPEALIKEGLKTLVKGGIEAKMPQIEAIMKDSSMDAKKQFMKILEIISGDEFVVDEGFEKFIKAMATGSYLKSGLDIQALQSIIRHAPVT